MLVSTTSCCGFTLLHVKPLIKPVSLYGISHRKNNNLLHQSKSNDEIIIETTAMEDDNYVDNISAEKDDNWKTLLDLALEKDPSFADIRIPFIDPLGNSFIECKPHFNVHHNGINYMIATPHDHTVGLCYTNEKTGKLVFLSDDIILNKKDLSLMDDVFKIASMELSKTFDDQLKLRRTPGTLTIEGELDKYIELVWNQNKGQTSKKKSRLKNMLIDAAVLTEDEEKNEDDFFESTMRALLGDDYDDDDDDDDIEIDSEIMELFDSFDDNNEEDFKTLMKEIFFNQEDVKGDDDDVSSPFSKSEDRMNSYAERLLSFNCDGKQFSLVKMTQPAIILGREDSEVENRRILLTPQESLTIMPKLEKDIIDELNAAGLF